MNSLPKELVNIIIDYKSQLEVSEKYEKLMREYKKVFKREENPLNTTMFLKLNNKIHVYTYYEPDEFYCFMFCSDKNTYEKHNYKRVKIMYSQIGERVFCHRNGIEKIHRLDVCNYKYYNTTIYKKTYNKKYKKSYLKTLRVKSLKKLCKKNNIKGYSKLNKNNLLLLLKKLKK